MAVLANNDGTINPIPKTLGCTILSPSERDAILAFQGAK
jgi:hypothetical protein